MLTKYKDVRPKKDVKNFLKNVFMSVAARIQEFFQGGGTKFRHIFKRSFFRQNCFEAC